MPSEQASTGAAGRDAFGAEAARRLSGLRARLAGLGGSARGPELDTSIVRFAWRHSKATQLGLLALTLLSFPFIYISLEIPKIIVNEAINGADFPVEILGVELEQIPYLLALCGVFLGLVVLINVFKWFLNIGIGMAGERLLRRLRYMLFEHVLRFPMKRFQSLRQREAVQSIMGECEQMGGFLGEILVTPLFQGGQLAVFIVFIFVQDVFLGLAAIALYPIQAYVIPILQRRIVRLNKARVANSRALADRLGESIGNIADIRANGTVQWHLAQVSGRLHENTRIRYSLFQRKFTIKFINNFLNQLTPFFFFSIGGYLVIRGQLDFGSLVAVLAAYKDLAGPWKALLNYFQRWTDFNSRFRFVVEGFAVDDLWPPERLHDEPRGVMAGPLVVERVRAGVNGEGVRLAAATIPQGARVAVVGGAGGAREQLMRLLAGLEAPEAGRISLGGRDLAETRLSEIGAAFAQVGPRPGMIQGTVRDNALYALFRRPPERKGDEEAALRAREARRTGNATAHPDGDWIDYAAAGVTGPEALQARLVALAESFGLSESLYGVALNRQLTPSQVARWRNPLMALRRRAEKQGFDVADLVEAWRIDAYNTNGTVLGNLLFALPVPQEGSALEPSLRPEVQALLERTGGAKILEEIGWKIARELAELAEAVGEASPVLDQLAAFSRQDILDASMITAAAGERGPGVLRKPHRLRLRLLSARFVEVRDQLEVLDDALKARILAARRRAQPLLVDYGDFVRFDEHRYSPMRTVADNILHARRRYDRRSEWSRIDALLRRVIRDEGLWRELVSIGFDVPLGEAGLSLTALRRLALLRAVIKRPAVLVVEGLAESTLEADTALRAALFAAAPETTIIFAANADATGEADMVLRIDDDGDARLT